MSSKYDNKQFKPPRQCLKDTAPPAPATLESVAATLADLRTLLTDLKEEVREVASAIEDLVEGDTESYDTEDEEEDA